MDSKREVFFDLNEPPIKDDEEIESTLPSSSHAFSHESSISGFQPFVRSRNPHISGVSKDSSLSKSIGVKDVKMKSQLKLNANVEGVEKEEVQVYDKNLSSIDKNFQEKCLSIEEKVKGNEVIRSRKDETNMDIKSDTNKGEEDTVLVTKQKEIKGIEANHALKCANKRPKVDHQKEAMLGKKRNRQTMFLNLEDVTSMKSLSPKKPNFLPPVTTRTTQQISSNTKQADLPSNEEFNNGNSSTELTTEAQDKSVTRKSWFKQGTDLKQPKIPPKRTAQTSHNPKLYSKKQPIVNNTQYHDTSVERLLREVTSEKFWHHPEEEELECVPGEFESVEEYVRVFEPLLFEECRAQLYSNWEELSETRDLHIKVSVKSVERRERGWYDVILLPQTNCKLTFKEGDVAVLTSSIPRSVRSRRSKIEEGDEFENGDRVAGTVRRYIPIDTRERLGAIFHFYVGESYNSYSKSPDNHIVRKLQSQSIWSLTALGSLATTQREYIALHAFHRLNSQMQNAILKPSPTHFPKYDSQTPSMPESITPNFVNYLHKNFNEPQLSAIKWAATHTAAGTNTSQTKKQDPWPFTLVQGPPGTGKTHTVWGMLNVIHLVQYQHYYTALLKKLAPESYKQVNETPESFTSGSIDELLQTMDQNLYRTLPKLCPKPRMLVCAPSNAATDELLSRVLSRGFIDGEMKVYRPDIARVGVDSQTRAAQAVSVERRTEQLLCKPRNEIIGYMHELRVRETQLSQQILSLQRELTINRRSQDSLGVDPEILSARDQNRDVLLQNLAAVVENRDKTLVEMSRLFIIEGKFRPGNNFNLEEARASLEASFANEAEIVFTTISSSGRRLFSRLTHGFDMVVIDEAAQASEIGVLPPLALGAARCVLVGDPQQLPATVISKAAGTLLYSRSLFERFQLKGCPSMLLSVQYRMHPKIRDFPSRYFYQGRLSDSESVKDLEKEMFYKDELLKPYVFFDVMRGRESHRDGSVSFENMHEVYFCVRLYEHLMRSCKLLGIGKVSVGIITPYKLQLKCLQREFKEILNTEEGKDVYINTVDAFQGQERDVIIMSCVRASGHGVGFVADIRRMNVALTRAKRALWIMGNGNALAQSDDWAALIADAKARNCWMDMDSLPKEFLAPKATLLPPSNRYFRHGIRHNNRQYDGEEEDEKCNSSMIQRNGSFRSFKPPMNNFDRSQNKGGVLGRRDL